MATRTTYITWLLLSGCAGAPAIGTRTDEATALRQVLQLPEIDITQRTCALYVALRSHALDESISFGQDLAEVDVHWNMCPGGQMVACKTAPGANGVPVMTGIPWPYPGPNKH